MKLKTKNRHSTDHQEYVVPSISFQIFLNGHLKLTKTREHSVGYCYTSYEINDQFFMISCSKEQLLQELKYALLKPDCHCWWISKKHSRL